jgi:hypothetical protein
MMPRNRALMVVMFAAICGSIALLPGFSQQADTGKQASPAAPQAAAPQNPIPDKFTNLQVLPRTISKPELVAIMKSFCKTMKVRCSHCHVANDDLSQADFPADDKPTKNDARELLRSILKAQQKPAPEAKP